MDFTYAGYSDLIAKLRDQGYTVANYQNWKETECCVILRHDVDNDLEQAAKLAEFEQSLGRRSTCSLITAGCGSGTKWRSEPTAQSCGEP